MTNIQEFLDTVIEREFIVSETEELLQRTNRTVWFTWGVTNITYYASKALALWVTAHHHQGWVVVTLAWDDTYKYYLVNQDFTIKKKVSNVYFDDLQRSIDMDIEYIEDYKF